MPWLQEQDTSSNVSLLDEQPATMEPDKPAHAPPDVKASLKLVINYIQLPLGNYW